ncbi:hypothetical protein DID75_01880 [Candidatus Marinamargulisbacteria bacterium SCGC AG-410-N11]|nr:hypothetical protein DID75_01880 [Candidatus Marinamargulisbacteria bacterium SCGC AG-410-N11]
MTQINKLGHLNNAIDGMSKIPQKVNSDSLPFQQLFNEAIGNQSTQMNIQPLYNMNQQIPFNENATLLAQNFSANELEKVERRPRQDQSKKESEMLKADNVNEIGIQAGRLEVTPFQMFLDKAVEALESISDLEFKVNDLTEQYVQGKASIDEVSIEATKLNLAVSFATTVITTASQTFMEITKMQI